MIIIWDSGNESVCSDYLQFCRIVDDYISKAAPPILYITHLQYFQPLIFMFFMFICVSK